MLARLHAGLGRQRLRQRRQQQRHVVRQFATLRRPSSHSQAVFDKGIIATASIEQQDYFVNKIDGNLT